VKVKRKVKGGACCFRNVLSAYKERLICGVGIPLFRPDLAIIKDRLLQLLPVFRYDQILGRILDFLQGIGRTLPNDPSDPSDKRMNLPPVFEANGIGLAEVFLNGQVFSRRTFVGPGKHVAQYFDSIHFVDSQQGINMGLLGDPQEGERTKIVLKCFGLW
jgi:hypothetical protein